MSTKELKSSLFADQHKLRDQLTLSDVGVFEVPDDLHQKVVLDEVGITAAQFKKLQTQEANLFTAVGLVASEKVAELWKTSPNIQEIGITYGQGATGKATYLFNRTEGGKATVLAHVDTRFETAEFNRVLMHADVMFAEINS